MGNLNVLTIDDVITLAGNEWAQRETRPSNPRLYVRWSFGAEYTLPSSKRNSTDHQTGQRHEGLSAVHLITIIDSILNGETIYWPLYETLRKSVEQTLPEYVFLPGSCYILRGHRTGTDTDNNPTITVSEILGVVQRNDIDRIIRLRKGN